MTDKQIIIEDCPHFIGGCCQEYLDGVCENHKCDLKIIRELEQKLKAKEQECDMWENIAVENGAVALKYQHQLDQLKAERDSYIDKYFLESQKVINLKKVLIEIKEIAEHCIKQDICTICDNSEKCHIEDEDVPTYDVCKLILQKISEV